MRRLQIIAVTFAILACGKVLFAATPEEIQRAIEAAKKELRPTPVATSPVVIPKTILPDLEPFRQPPNFSPTPKSPSRPVEGQLSPRGQWRYTSGQWVKIKFAAPAWPEYPTRSVTGSRWRYNGGQITAAHLASPSSHHAHEHFDYAWLRTLSNAQLTALGSDAHEGNVREAYVVREGASGYQAAPRAAVRRQAAPVSSCPNGNCPNTSTGGWRLFGRWR